MRARHLSQRNYQLVQEIRRMNEDLRQRDRGMHIRHRTLNADGALVATGPVIEAVPVQENVWAA